MKVALVHDWLNTRVGGSEKVLIEMSKLYPDADIYTLFFRQEFYGGMINPKRVKTSYLQKWPRFLTDKPHWLLPLLPKAIEQFDLSSYDLVISSSNAFCKGVITPPSTLHVSYCYSPMRFAWDYWPRYLDEQSYGRVRRFLATMAISKVRQWDYYSAQRVDKWLTISNHIARRIKKFYGADSLVIYPPVELGDLKPAEKKQSYYVTLATLTPYKKIDHAIQACQQLGRKLIVIGDGFDRQRLESMAGPNVSFVGRVSDSEKAKLLKEARGLIQPQEEDFGIAAVEAMACGTPVIAFGSGGASEIVTDAKTGILYSESTTGGLLNALKRFEKIKFETSDLVSASHKFDASRFAKEFTSTVNSFYEAHHG